MQALSNYVIVNDDNDLADYNQNCASCNSGMAPMARCLDMGDCVDGTSNVLLVGEGDSYDKAQSQHEAGAIYAVELRVDADDDDSAEAVTGCGSAPINWNPVPGGPDDGQEDKNSTGTRAGRSSCLPTVRSGSSVRTFGLTGALVLIKQRARRATICSACS